VAGFVRQKAGAREDLLRRHVSADPGRHQLTVLLGWTDPPILRHAGSDLERLMRIAQPSTVDRRDAAAMTADEINRLVDTTPAGPQPDRAFGAAVPTIGMYGQPGESKGTYDLVGALGIVRAAGLDFNLVLLSGYAQNQRLTAAIETAGIGDRTWRLPFIPHRRLAGFIRACTAVCFLERGFPAPTFDAVGPHEVLSTGTCLVLSGAIHAKLRSRDQLIDGDNLVLVDDPRDRETLAKKFHALIERPELAAEIGSRGQRVAAALTRRQ
jgi:glycosyltransferase involved in cell wall biosynthesis